MYNLRPYLEKIEQVIEKGPFKDDWASLANFRTPEWYQQAKFGIFIHWGLYSVPSFGSEWYSRNMYIQGSPEFEHHVKTYGPHKEFGYKDFIPMFKAEKFNADEWAQLFKEAGARYIVPVAEHHDGFQMYQSEISHWNAAEMGPKRDVLGELKQSFEKCGLTLGASTHRVEHWFFMSHGRDFDSDIKEPMQCGDFYWPAMKEPSNHHDLFSEPTPTQEFLEDWLVRCCELIDRYRPKLVYFDWWIQHSAVKPYLKKFAAYYYNRAAEWGEEVAINYKHEAFMFGAAVPDVERGQFAEMKPYFWQTDTAIARNSWGYTEGNVYKSAKGLICDLVDIVSKNGTLLLNVGPKPDGSIGPEDTAILKEIGEWMAVNGEAVYGTHVWRKFGEGPTLVKEGQFTDGVEKVFTFEDIRFTAKGDCLYATVLSWPEDGCVTVRSLAEADASRLPLFHGIIRDADILGFDVKPEWKRDEEGLHVCAPSVKTDKPVVIRIQLD
ncbi:MAG: alpha-L-fucosidase [Clostridiales bacterium]|nr:alpha-L-fucosidase [Clostridiales bacterium]